MWNEHACGCFIDEDQQRGIATLNRQLATPSYVIKYEEPRKQIWLPELDFHVGVGALVAFIVAMATGALVPFVGFMVLWLAWIFLEWHKW